MQPPSSNRVSLVAAAAAAGPPAAGLLAGAWILAGWILGANPFWPVQDLNVTEAAAVRDHAEVVRLIESGQDPSRAWPVRVDIIDSSAHMMTPLEAAVRIQRLELVKLLARHGAVMTPATRAALIQLATGLKSDDIVAYLREGAY